MTRRQVLDRRTAWLDTGTFDGLAGCPEQAERYDKNSYGSYLLTLLEE